MKNTVTVTFEFTRVREGYMGEPGPECELISERQEFYEITAEVTPGHDAHRDESGIPTEADEATLVDVLSAEMMTGRSYKSVQYDPIWNSATKAWEGSHFCRAERDLIEAAAISAAYGDNVHPVFTIKNFLSVAEVVF